MYWCKQTQADFEGSMGLLEILLQKLPRISRNCRTMFTLQGSFFSISSLLHHPIFFDVNFMSHRHSDIWNAEQFLKGNKNCIEDKINISSCVFFIPLGAKCKKTGKKATKQSFSKRNEKFIIWFISEYVTTISNQRGTLS